MLSAHEEKGLDPPDFIVNAPVPFEGGEKYLNAFWLLSGSRTSSGGGLNPVPLTEIQALFHIYRIHDIQDRDDYVFFIRRLDQTFMRFENERMEKERKRLEARANKPGAARR